MVTKSVSKKKPTVNRVASISENGNGKRAIIDGGALKMKPVLKKRMRLTLDGTSLLVQHAWGKKAAEMMRLKHAGKKTKNRDIRDPEQEGKDAGHYTASGHYGVPAGAVKKSILGAAHKDLGIEKTLVKRSGLKVICDDPGNILKLTCNPPEIREDTVRVGMGTTDLRYRPYFLPPWSIDIVLEYDGELLTDQDVLILVERAGFGVGLLEMRPEKGGDYGCFRVSNSVPIEIEIAE